MSTWERDWRRLTGWKRWLVVAGAIHASFTDLPLVADQAGIDVGAHLPGARSLDITRAYVLAFFDEHLRGERQSLLDGPSARYPEVGFRFPRLCNLVPQCQRRLLRWPSERDASLWLLARSLSERIHV